MMIAADLTPDMKHKLWAEAVDCAEQIGNIVPGRENEKSPDELFYKKKPTLYKSLIPFGTIGYVTYRNKMVAKLNDKARKCLMIGYAKNNVHDTCRLYDPLTKCIILSRDVKWSEWKRADET